MMKQFKSSENVVVIRIEYANLPGEQPEKLSGYVAVIPVGLDTVGSVVLDDAIKVGATVRKGISRLGNFYFGGSLNILLFSKGMVSPAVQTRMGNQIGIINVGEIRDAETAEIACQAALTGHLVLSTLHTNDAISAIPRLLDLGVERFKLAGALRGIVAQRLLRRLCSRCSIRTVAPVPQFGHVHADISASTWTASAGTSLYTNLDEPNFFNDADYIESAESDGLLTIQLREGYVLVAEWTKYRTTGLETYDLTVTEEQWRTVRNWSNLAIWLTVNETETAKLLFEPLDPPTHGTLTLRVRIDMGL